MVWTVHCGLRLSVRQTKPVFWCLFLSILVETGCRSNPPQAVPVSGVVTLDGKPLAGAAITFMPVEGGCFGLGYTNENGEFTIGTFADTDGALVGVHRISIMPDIISPAAMGRTLGGEEEMDRRGESNRVLKSRIPEKYASHDTSGLRVDVKKGMPPVKFDLTRN